MAPPQTPLVERFPEYVAELRDVSNMHRVPYGKPVNLFDLVEALRISQAFASDFGSAIRSIVFREHFQAAESELLSLLTVAWAGEGPHADSGPHSYAIEELRKMLREVLGRPISGPMIPESDDTEDDDTEHEDTQDDPQLPETQPTPDPTPSLAINHRSDRLNIAAPEPIQLNAVPSAGIPTFSGLALGDTDSSSHDPFLKPTSGRRLKPSAAETVALGLAGLVTALLFSVASLPVYRAQVSVYMPSGDSDASPRSPGAAFVNGEVTEQVAQRLLGEPHPAPILRQDVLSRGMRELHIGGDEPILYADLVSETARRVKIKQLQPADLYEVSCDSWSAQFAATFCNLLATSLTDHSASPAGSQPGTATAHTIDTASDPGHQVYPHWYLQGFVGLIFGCVIGLSLGLTKWPAPQTQRSEIGEN